VCCASGSTGWEKANSCLISFAAAINNWRASDQRTSGIRVVAASVLAEIRDIIGQIAFTDSIYGGQNLP
jgi:hypothetical protein